MSTAEQETRQRVLDAAARLFAARGFHHVTVREICRAADANVAAVNYHFRDKLGLYTAVVRAAIGEMRRTSAEAMQAASRGTPEEKLRAHVLVYLRRLVGRGPASWIHQLMAREMADPTPALDLVVEEAIRPRLAQLGAIVAELLGCAPGDPRVPPCVASVQGQCLLYAPNPVAVRLVSGWPPAADELDRIADHITAFSLAGIRAVAARRPTGQSSSAGRSRAGDRPASGSVTRSPF